MSAQPTERNTATRRSEHISLESDLSETRAQPKLDRPLSTYDLNKSGRGVTSRVSILPDHFVLIETQRRSSVVRDTVDLRFVDPRPVGIRKVARRSLIAGLIMTALTVLAGAAYAMWPSVGQQFGGLLTPIALGALAIGCFLTCYYLTSEALLFVSMHGRARVIVIAGRLGTMRRAHQCAADIVAHIKVAHRKFQQARPTQLRDEMREHSRLRDQGTITDQQYDEAKKRILQSHA